MTSVNIYHFLLLFERYYFGKLTEMFFKEDKDNWLDMANKAMELSTVILSGTFKLVELHFYAALVYLQVCKDLKTNEEKQVYFQKIDKILVKMKVI